MSQITSNQPVLDILSQLPQERNIEEEEKDQSKQQQDIVNEEAKGSQFLEQENQYIESQEVKPYQDQSLLLQSQNFLAAMESNDEGKKSIEEDDCQVVGGKFKEKSRFASIIIDDDEMETKQNEKKQNKNIPPQQDLSSQAQMASQHDSEKQEVLLPPPSQDSSDLSSKRQPQKANEIPVTEEKKIIEDKNTFLDQLLRPDPQIKKTPKEQFSYTQPLPEQQPYLQQQKKQSKPVFIDLEEEQQNVIIPQVSVIKQKIEDTSTPYGFHKKKILENQATSIEIFDKRISPIQIEKPISNQINQQQKKAQTILEEIIQEDDGLIQDMDLQSDWIPVSSINNVQPPKFSGQPRMLEYTQDQPKDMIRLLYGDLRFKELLKTCQANENEFWLYLGTKLMMGYMRLPDVTEYFYREDWIAGGGIRSIITQLQFEEIDSKVDIVQPQLQTQSQLAVKLEQNSSNYFHQEFLPQFTQEVNDRFRRLVMPGQEMFLIQNCWTLMYSTRIQWYQLIDKTSGIVLHQFFWANPVNKNQDIINHRDLQNRLRLMFEPYHLGRHVIYSQGILNAESVIKLQQQKIYVCTDLNQHSLLPNAPQSEQAFFSSKHKEPIYLQYKNESWTTCVSLQSLVQRNNLLSQLSQQQLCEEKIAIQPGEMENVMNFAPSKTIFVFIMESILHNIRILKKQELKQFRSQLSLQLVNKKIDFLNPKPLLRKDGAELFHKDCQTDQTIGIVNEQLYHCPIHNGNARCLVCLNKGILSKTSASCLGCSKVLNHNIFLCVYPCFRLFHLDPKQYLNPGMYYQVVSGYAAHDQDQEEEEVEQQLLDANLKLKPDTSELDSIYAKSYQDFKNMIPINYEDNYHKKTTIVVIQREKGVRRGGGGRPRAQRPQQAQQQTEQGNTGDNQESKKMRKQNKKSTVNAQQQQMPEKEPEQVSNAMFDFFSQVRKQAYKKQAQQ